MVVFAGGGTGGHLYPALAIADALRAIRPDVHTFFVGARRGLEARVLPERGEPHLLLPVEGLDRSRPLTALRVLGGLAVSLARIVRLFSRLAPDVVVVTGGYAGAPAGIVAGLMGVPLVLQEQNSVPGLVTKILTRWALRVHVAFPEAVDALPAGRGRALVTGNPVRPPSARSMAQARAALNLPVEGVVALLVGGSQGSAALNRAMLAALDGVERGDLVRPGGLQLLWATGPTHHAAVAAALAGRALASWVHAVAYLEDIATALASADVAIGRAGAMFTAELLNQGLPSILVPLPTAAADHQSHNANALASAGAALVLAEAGLSGGGLWGALCDLVEEPGAMERMGAAARARARPFAARDIASDVGSLLAEGGARA